MSICYFMWGSFKPAKNSRYTNIQYENYIGLKIRGKGNPDIQYKN